MEEKIISSRTAKMIKCLKIFAIICTCIPTILTWPIAIVLWIMYFYNSKMELTVTNTRIYGCLAFGKRVDLPNDSITAVGTSAFRGVDVSTASGVIKFKGIENNTEIHKAISDIIISRQQKGTGNSSQTPIAAADELKKFKDLLDDGIITQEEFDAKKKQLLGL